MSQVTRNWCDKFEWDVIDEIDQSIIDLHKDASKIIDLLENIRDKLEIPSLDITIKNLNNFNIYRSFLGQKIEQKYTNLREALLKLTESNILISFEDLGQYVIFDTGSQYHKFLCSVALFNKKVLPDFSQCQIVLANNFQKITFFISLKNIKSERSTNMFKQALSFCNKYFGQINNIGDIVILDETEFRKEIIVQTVVPNFAKSTEIITNFESSLIATYPVMQQHILIDVPFPKRNEKIQYIEFPIHISKLFSLKMSFNTNHLLRTHTEEDIKNYMYNSEHKSGHLHKK